MTDVLYRLYKRPKMNAFFVLFFWLLFLFVCFVCLFVLVIDYNKWLIKKRRYSTSCIFWSFCLVFFFLNAGSRSYFIYLFICWFIWTALLVRRLMLAFLYMSLTNHQDEWSVSTSTFHRTWCLCSILFGTNSYQA